MSIASILLTPHGFVAVDRLTERLGMTRPQLGDMLGLSPETLRKKERTEAPRTQARLREASEILSRVEVWTGGPRQALAWYVAEPLPGFGGRTAESLVKSGDAAKLRDYLDSLALGGFA
ncbi:MAG: antitoxin Xre/MbcA/ParS toxin-binding domain-containing protein [Beijerinckiaceae bacterium]